MNASEMKTVAGIKSEIESTKEQMQTTWKITEYQELNEKIRRLEFEIAVALGKVDNYAMVARVRERIDELETNRAKALLQKKSCNNIKEYRKLVNSIELIDQAIDYNRTIIQQAAT